MANRQHREPWRNAERHFCAICNSWMGSDRQSILLHENGKKHKDKLEASFQQRRQEKLEQEKAQKVLQSSLAQVERAAARAHALDPTFATASIPLPSQQSTIPAESRVPAASNAKREKQEWESRKKERVKTKKKGDEDNTNEPPLKKAKRKLAPDEGHYTHGDATYLEGQSFCEILEEDMPVQIWTGSSFADLGEKRLPEKEFQWRNGLILAVRKSSRDPCGVVVDVAYLQSPADEEETLEKSVSPGRIRIILGADESIPDTLEEARLVVLGEEVTEVEESLEIDDNTGISSWGTVQIRKTTARSELKEERDRTRAKQREEIERADQEQKEAEARRMEEAKVENADDSALGAYDVWTSGKGGYKGVDINQEAKLDVQDTAKSLAKGMGAVGFKKKQVKKKQNRRTTCADDD
jgi:WW domain-binding protein 4